MRPVEVERALERLAVDLSTARAQLGEIRNQLGRARSIVAEIRRLLGEDRRTARDGTPAGAYAQGEKG